jgi:hypothetical protein
MFHAFSRFCVYSPDLSSGCTDQILIVIMAIECALQRIPCHIHEVTTHGCYLGVRFIPVRLRAGFRALFPLSNTHITGVHARNDEEACLG